MFRRSSARGKVPVGSPDAIFVPADPSLDLMIQARVNLTVFKAYLEHDSSDSGGHYDIVAQTMSRACSQFTNRTAELEIKLAEARTGAMDIEAQEQAILDQKQNHAAELARLESEEAQLKAELAKLLAEQNAKVDDATKQKVKRKTVIAVREERDRWQSQHRLLSEDLEKERQNTAALAQELAVLEAESAKVDLTGQIDHWETRIKELTAVAKAAEEREVRVVEAKKAPVTPPKVGKTTTFVIHDTVKISGQEMEHLAFMVRALSEDNERLCEERNSRMMDIDCLMQENMGLKQLLREMVEGG
jgi:hypothetical protein